MLKKGNIRNLSNAKRSLFATIMKNVFYEICRDYNQRKVHSTVKCHSEEKANKHNFKRKSL